MWYLPLNMTTQPLQVPILKQDWCPNGFVSVLLPSLIKKTCLGIDLHWSPCKVVGIIKRSITLHCFFHININFQSEIEFTRESNLMEPCVSHAWALKSQNTRESNMVQPVRQTNCDTACAIKITTIRQLGTDWDFHSPAFDAKYDLRSKIPMKGLRIGTSPNLRYASKWSRVKISWLASNGAHWK